MWVCISVIMMGGKDGSADNWGKQNILSIPHSTPSLHLVVNFAIKVFHYFNKIVCCSSVNSMEDGNANLFL